MNRTARFLALAAALCCLSASAPARPTQVSAAFAPTFSVTNGKQARKLVFFIAPVAPIFYDFTTGEGWTNTTSLSGLNGFNTLLDNGGTGVTTAIKVNTTSGYAYGTSANTGAHAAKSATAGDGWVRYTQIGSGNLELHRSMVGGTDSFSGFRITVPTVSTAPLSSIGWKLQGYLNGVAQGSIITVSPRFRFGDVFDVETIGTSLFFYHNGRQITQSTNLLASGFPTTGYTLTGAHGWQGNSSTTGSTDDMEFGTAATGRLRLWQPARVVQREADGTVQFYLEGSYTKDAPAALKYTITTSAKATVTGQTAQTLAATIGGGLFSGLTSAFTPAASTSYVITTYRDDAVSGGIIKSHGPYVDPGEIMAVYGQSNATRGFAGSGTTSWTVANAWTLDGTTGDVSTDSNPMTEMDAVTVTSATSSISGALSSLGTAYSAPVLLIKGGVGSTTIEDRGVGSVPWTSFKNAVRYSGRRLRFVDWADGESNAAVSGASGSAASYPATFAAMMSDLNTFNGRAITYLMKPVGANSNATTPSSGSNAAWEAIRRAQAKLAFDYAAVKVSSYANDLQHFVSGTVDALHYGNGTSSESYTVMFHRMAMMRLYLDGKSAYHLLGPRLISVAKVDSTHVDVTMGRETLDSLSLLNGSVNSDYRGGIRLGTTSASLSAGQPGDLGATAAAPQSNTGTTETWRLTLSATVAGSIYVAGPGGEQPFNPTGSSTINLNFRTKASMFVGNKTGETDQPALQPFYCFSGATNDNSTAAGCTPGNDWLVAA